MSSPPLDKDSKLWKSAEEVHEPVQVKIQGQVPPWLNGTYLRVGPGKFDLGEDFTLNHWCDGYSILSKFDINGLEGSVTFQTKFLESEAFQKAQKNQMNIYYEYGTPGHSEPGKGFFSKLMSQIIPEASDNANCSYFKLGGRGQSNGHGPDIFVTGESCYFHHLDPSSLTPSQKFSSKHLFGLETIGAHPITDHETGVTWNIGCSVLTGLKYNVLKIPPATSPSETPQEQLKRGKVICSIGSRWTSLLSFNHSFGLSSNYIVFIEQPFLINVTSLLGGGLKGKGGGCPRDWMEWRPEVKAKFHIISKATGKVLNPKWEILSSESFFFAHVINCFEVDEDTIVIDLVKFRDPEYLLSQRLDRLRSGVGTKDWSEAEADDLQPDGVPSRFVIPLKLNPEGPLIHCGSGTTKGAKAERGGSKNTVILTPVDLTGPGMELPIINPKFIGKDYGEFYGTGLCFTGGFKNSVFKIELRNPNPLIFRESEHWIFGEPAFVGSGPETEEEEDDGVLIVPMTDSRKGHPDALFFLNPKDMTELGRVIFPNEIRVPPSLHGIFIPEVKN